MSETDVRIKVLTRNGITLQSYDLEELTKAHTFANSEQPTRDIDSILRESGLLPGRNKNAGKNKEHQRSLH